MDVLLLYAAVVLLTFVLEFVTFVREPQRIPVSAAADVRWWPRLDRRLALVGGAAAVLFVAGLITMDLNYPHSSVRWDLIHPYALLAYGAMFCLIALLCGVKLRQPVLLLCLTLPGLVVMPLVWFSAIATSNNVIAAAATMPLVFFLQPGVWILLFIAIGQALLLRKPGANFTPGGLVRLALILAAYLYGTFSATLRISEWRFD